MTAPAPPHGQPPNNASPTDSPQEPAPAISTSLPPGRSPFTGTRATPERIPQNGTDEPSRARVVPTPTPHNRGGLVEDAPTPPRRNPSLDGEVRPAKNTSARTRGPGGNDKIYRTVTRTRVYLAVAAYPGSTVADIARETGFGVDGVRTACNTLRAAGLIISQYAPHHRAGAIVATYYIAPQPDEAARAKLEYLTTKPSAIHAPADIRSVRA